MDPEMASQNWTMAQLNSFMFQLFQDRIFNMSNKSATSESINPVGLVESATKIIGWGTLAVEFPMLLLASYALARLIKADNMAPVFVINLLATDLIQVIVRPAFMLAYTRASSVYLSLRDPVISDNSTSATETPAVIFYFALSAGNGFTLCIALERYLLVAYPLWYRCRRSLRHSLLVSIVTWVAAGLAIVLQSQLAQERLVFFDSPEGGVTVLSGDCGDFCPLQSLLLLSPLPLLLFFLFGTRRALAGSQSVSTLEQRKILGVLVLVLANYTVLFLPSVAVLLFSYSALGRNSHFGPTPDQTLLDSLDAVALALVYVSPLLDTLLYVLLRRDAQDTLEAFLCMRWLLSRWSRDSSAPATSRPQVKSLYTSA